MDIDHSINQTSASATNNKRCCSNICDGNQEVKAMSWEFITQGISIQGAAFFITAILELAKQIAGCEMDDADTPCEGTIYGGIPPKSLLLLIVTVAGFTASVMMPFAGSVIDKIPYRRGVALGTAVILICISALKITLSEEMFDFNIILTGLNPLVMLLHVVSVLAYLHELTDDEKRLGQYMGLFIALRSSAGLLFMILVIGLGVKLPMPERGSVEFTVRLAQIAQLADVILSSLCFIPTFVHKGFKRRPPLSKLEPGTSLFGSAGRQLCSTIKTIYQTWPALKWFLISSLLVGSVQSATSAIVLSLMVDFLHMSPAQISVAIFIYNTFQIVGAILFKILSKRLCIFRALKVITLFFSFTFIIASLVVRSTKDIPLLFMFIGIWSLGFGWILPNARTIFVTIIPKGQEAEMMGLFLFFANGFVWLPTLVATILTGYGVSWPVVLGTLSVYTFLSLVTLTFMGSYSSAKQHAMEMSEGYLKLNEEKEGKDGTGLTGTYDAEMTLENDQSIEENPTDSNRDSAVEDKVVN